MRIEESTNKIMIQEQHFKRNLTIVPEIYCALEGVLPGRGGDIIRGEIQMRRATGAVYPSCLGESAETQGHEI